MTAALALVPDNGGRSAYIEERTSNRKDWLALRTTGVGSSDCAAALDLDPYRSATELFLEKVGLIEPKDLSDNEAVITGNDLEAYVADRYERKTGRKVQRVNATWRSRAHPFMVANIDRRIVGMHQGLECKTVGFWAAQQSEDWGDPETGAFDAVPQRYFLQCAHSAIVAGWEAWDLLALVAGQKIMGPYTISPDADLRKAIVEGEMAFWQRVERARERLAAGDSPESIVSRFSPPATRKSDLSLRWKRSERKPIEATRDILALFDEMMDARKKRAAAEADVDERQITICAFMGDCDELVYEGQTLATWRTIKARELFDAKRHATDVPDCHAEYASVGTAPRPFVVKEPK